MTRPITKIGKLIEALQRKAGFDGNDTGFAAEIGIHVNTLYKWKTGQVQRIKKGDWALMNALAERPVSAR